MPTRREFCTSLSASFAAIIAAQGCTTDAPEPTEAQIQAPEEQDITVNFSDGSIFTARGQIVGNTVTFTGNHNVYTVTL